MDEKQKKRPAGNSFVRSRSYPDGHRNPRSALERVQIGGSYSSLPYKVFHRYEGVKYERQNTDSYIGSPDT